MSSMKIEEGYYGEVPLDGLCWINLYRWPGAVHEGNGTHQSIIDERADEKQRHALNEIIHGRASVEGSSFLYIFGTTMTKVYDPLFLPIEYEINIAECTARVVVPGLLESTGSPMIDPFSGDAHRARLVLPNGMEFLEAECGSGTTKSSGKVELDFTDTWGQFSRYHIKHDGIVR